MGRSDDCGAAATARGEWFVNVRALGLIGMIGGVAYTSAGLRMLLLGVPEDRFTDLLGVVLAACWIAGGIGLLRLRVTGESNLGRSVAWLLVAGFSMAVLWGIYRLIDPPSADRSILAVAPLLVVLGMLGTGLLVLRTGMWLETWRRWVPLAIALVYAVTIAASVMSGQPTISYAFTFAGIGYMILGRTMRGVPIDNGRSR
jgi:hypothetical protein